MRLNIMNQQGHSALDTLIEDPTNKIEKVTLAEIEAKFNECLKNGGFAYAPDGKGQGTQMKTFDPTADEITLRPQLIGG